MEVTDCIAVTDENQIRRLLLEDLISAFHAPGDERAKCRQLKDLFRRNYDVYDAFSMHLLNQRLLSSDSEYNTFRHYYLGLANGCVQYIHGVLDNSFSFEGLQNCLEESFSGFDLMRLPLIFGHLKKVAERSQISYQSLLKEFLGYFELSNHTLPPQL